MYKFDQNEIAHLSGLAIYIFKTENTWLYVGYSQFGLHRALNPNHHCATKAQKEATELLLIPCEVLKDALALEQQLIDEHKPKYNMPYRQQLEELEPVSKEVLDLIEERCYTLKR